MTPRCWGRLLGATFPAQHTPGGAFSTAGALEPREGFGHSLLPGVVSLGPGAGNVPGTEGTIRVDKAGDAVATETPVGLGMALGSAHEGSVDSSIPVPQETTCPKAT